MVVEFEAGLPWGDQKHPAMELKMNGVNVRRAWTMMVCAGVLGVVNGVHGQSLLVKGPPALTQQMVDQTAAVAEWALGLQLSAAQREQWKGILVDFWKKESLPDMGGVLDLVDFEARLRSMTPAQREQLAQQSRPTLLEQLRRNAATAPDDKFLLEVYEAWNDRPVVPARDGSPGLTPSMMRTYAAMMELAYDIRLDEGQRKMLDRHLVRVWMAQEKQNMQNVQDWIAREKELTAMGPGMRMGIGRFDIYPAVIEQARKDAATDPEVRDLLAIHDEQHRPLAGGAGGAGDVPLIRPEAEAFLGVLFFIASKGEGLNGGAEIRPPLEVQEAFVTALKENWAEMPAENKAGFKQMPELYAKLQVLWDKSEADVQKQFVEAIGSSPQGQEVRARVRELRAAEVARAKELKAQRDASRAQSAARAEAAKRGVSQVAKAGSAGAGGPVTPAAPSGMAGGGGKPTAGDFAKASHDLAMERMKTQMISNMMHTMHQNRMMVIYNMGPGFEWKRQ